MTISPFERWSFIHGTMQVPQRHHCEGKQRVGAAPPSSILLRCNPPCSQTPFNCSFILDVYFYSFRSLFAISRTAYPTRQQAAPWTQPNHKPAIEENESQVKDSIICINALWFLTFYKTVTKGNLMQAKINFWGGAFCSNKGKLQYKHFGGFVSLIIQITKHGKISPE